MALYSTLVAALAAASLASPASAYTPNRPGSENRYPFAKPYDQSFLEGYSILKHVGGQGPYSNRQSYGIGRDPPDGCAVDQVIMLKRHGERWPDPGPAANFKTSLNKIYATNGTLSGSLSFLNRWTYFIPGDRYVALESYNGPYAGLLDGYRHGAEHGVRYGHLWDPTAANQTIPMFSSGYERILMTARKFGEGFFGWNYTDVVAMNIVPEEVYMGANSLTPSCLSDNDTAVCGNLTNLQPQFSVAAARLNAENGLQLNASDVYNLMQMTAYELNVRGYSDWVDVFSLDEWVAFGYTQDLSYYYCSGPGDKNMRAVGAVFANASLTLLNQGPGPNKTGAIYLNFCHDTNITPVLAALGLSTPSQDLPLDHIPFPNEYNTANIVPMGGHLTLERLTCNATAVTDAGVFVRHILNEAVVPYTGCQSGPGFSCSLANYTTLLSSSLPNFIQTCGFNSSYPQYLDFWWNYNTTHAYNYETQSPIPAEEGLLTYQGTAAE